MALTFPNSQNRVMAVSGPLNLGIARGLWEWVELERGLAEAFRPDFPSGLTRSFFQSGYGLHPSSPCFQLELNPTECSSQSPAILPEP